MNNCNAIYLKYIEESNTKESGDIMCDVLRRMRGLSAERILENTCQERSAPVDLDMIIDFLSVKKFSTSFTNIEKNQNKGKVSGLVLVNGNDVGIFYKKDDSIEQKRFVISHELGHCCLHGDSLENGYIELLRNDGFENEREESATVFAMNLLVPEMGLKDVIAKLLLPSVRALSEIFQVPENIMIKRMENLNLAYYLDDKDKLVKPRL